MRKFFIVAGLTIGLVVCYWALMGLQPAINAIVVTANATGNYTGFESAQHVIEAWPLYMWFIPAGVYLIAVVLALRSE